MTGERTGWHSRGGGMARAAPPPQQEDSSGSKVSGRERDREAPFTAQRLTAALSLQTWRGSPRPLEGFCSETFGLSQQSCLSWEKQLSVPPDPWPALGALGWVKHSSLGNARPRPRTVARRAGRAKVLLLTPPDPASPCPAPPNDSVYVGP